MTSEIITWQDRINLARINDGFTASDRELASKWNSCALSENPKLINAKLQKNETHSDLIDLGNDFFLAVVYDDFNGAEEILNKFKQEPIPA